MIARNDRIYLQARSSRS